MAITVRVDSEKSLLDKCSQGFQFITGQIDFVNPYVVGGMAWDLTPYFPGGVMAVFVENKGGYFFEYIYATKLLKAYYFDYDAGADGKAIDCAAIDLSGLTGVRFLAIGRR